MKTILSALGHMAAAAAAEQAPRPSRSRSRCRSHSLESMPIYVAQDKGIFKKHGVDIDVITSRGGGEAMKAYIAGDVADRGDRISRGRPDARRGVDVKLFFAQTSRVPFALIGARNGHQVGRRPQGQDDRRHQSRLADLRTSPATSSSRPARSGRDVSLVSVGGGGEILGRAEKRRADAAMLFEPFVTIAIKQGIAHMLVDVPEELDAFSSSPLSTSKAFVEKSPKEAKAIFDALAEAMAFIHSDKAGDARNSQENFCQCRHQGARSGARTDGQVLFEGWQVHACQCRRTQKISVALKVMPQVYPLL